MTSWICFSVAIRTFLMAIMIFVGLNLGAAIFSNRTTCDCPLSTYVRTLTAIGALFYLFQFCLPT
jgi:Na+/phosphate symporter